MRKFPESKLERDEKEKEIKRRRASRKCPFFPCLLCSVTFAIFVSLAGKTKDEAAGRGGGIASLLLPDSMAIVGAFFLIPPLPPGIINCDSQQKGRRRKGSGCINTARSSVHHRGDREKSESWYFLLSLSRDAHTTYSLFLSQIRCGFDAAIFTSCARVCFSP